MATDLNKGKAEVLYQQLSDELPINQWIKLLVKAVGFLLARYIDGK